MSDLKVTLDLSSLSQFFEKFAKDISQDIQKGIEGLATSTHAHIKEEAQNKLSSFREQYLENLGEPEQIDKYMWCITLNSDATWIEEGIPQPYDMKVGLLNTQRPGSGKVHTSKDGKKYRIVPMNQGKTPTQMSPNTAGYETIMVNKVKSELKKRGINYKKLELNENGSPRVGKLHSLDIDSYIPGKGNTPQLHGINIYQTHNKKTGKVERKITTFRTVTEDQTDKWIHPPVEARDFFKEAKTWAEKEFETKWLPDIVSKYK